MSNNEQARRQEKTAVDRPEKRAEQGMEERLAANPEAAVRELRQQARQETQAFADEGQGLVSGVERSAGASLDAEASEQLKEVDSGVAATSERLGQELDEAALESREVPIEYKEVEFFGADGKKMGTLIIGTEQVLQKSAALEKAAGQEGEQRVSLKLRPRTRSLVIRGEIDGQPSEIDLIKEAGLEDVPIHFTADSEARKLCAYVRRANMVVSSPPDNPVQFGVLSHEIGHAQQMRDPRLQEVGDHTDRAKELFRQDRPRWSEARPIVEALYRSFPETKAIDRGMFDTLDSLSADESRLDEELIRAEAAEKVSLEFGNRRGSEEAGRKAGELRQELDRVRQEMNQFVFRLKRVVHLAVKIPEIDATARAFDLFKRVKERTGVDFTQATRVPKEQAGWAEPECEESLGHDAADGLVTIDPVERLYRALKTYDIKNPEKALPDPRRNESDQGRLAA